MLCVSPAPAITIPGVGVAMREDAVDEATAAVVAAMFIIIVVVLTDIYRRLGASHRTCHFYMTPVNRWTIPREKNSTEATGMQRSRTNRIY